MVVIDVEPIRERFSTVAPFLDERGRRLVAAAEAFAAGYGGRNPFRATTVFVEAVTRVLSSCVLDAFMEDARGVTSSV